MSRYVKICICASYRCSDMFTIYITIVCVPIMWNYVVYLHDCYYSNNNFWIALARATSILMTLLAGFEHTHKKNTLITKWRKRSWWAKTYNKATPSVSLPHQLAISHHTLWRWWWGVLLVVQTLSSSSSLLFVVIRANVRRSTGDVIMMRIRNADDADYPKATKKWNAHMFAHLNALYSSYGSSYRSSIGDSGCHAFGRFRFGVCVFVYVCLWFCCWR